MAKVKPVVASGALNEASIVHRPLSESQRAKAVEKLRERFA